ncbi:unnamed protein product [Adineta ricciae]|uniref:G-protein coupled receptors family 1 profile domain-containing protein n=1 Tax=Adineta ricciae TaxID=249248 RepID=A0A815UWS5_ADIRI|nr:unnamed protein product [Adineta ricciae]CAF1523094.1 unnamed protein product [Adineta ricciae]
MDATNNSMSVPIQPWFIPIDILDIICLTIVLIIVSFFLTIIILDKTCHSIPMLLVANSCVTELIFTGDILWMAIITLQNDLTNNTNPDSLCIFRGYVSYVMCCAQNYSYLLQAVNRYLSVVYPTRLFWQTKRVQIFLIVIMWIVAIVCAWPHLFTSRINYLPDNQICQMPLQFSIISLYNVFFLYIIPMNSIILIYLKLVRYVKAMNTRITPVNTLLRARRDLTMVYRIVILVFILLALGFPYVVFIFMGYFSTPPRYHFRIAYVFIDVSLVLIMVTIFRITDPLRASIMRRVNRREITNVVTVT